MVVPVLMTSCQVSEKPKKRTGHGPHQDDRHRRQKGDVVAGKRRGASGEVGKPAAQSPLLSLCAGTSTLHPVGRSSRG